MQGKSRGSVAHSMSTLAAKRALEAAEKQLQDSQQELANVAELLRVAEEEVAAAVRTEEERKESAARARDDLEDGLARTIDPAKSQEGPTG
eukprot:11836099-Heterocapsa_arctica.AAC.1